MTMQVEMVMWDVQHGHATYVKSPNQRHIVVDLGIGSHDDSNTTFSPLIHLKNRYGVSKLDYVIITHPHLDHIDDILNFDALNPEILRRPNQLTNEEVLCGVRNADKAKFEKYCEINNRYNSPVSSDSIYNTGNPDNFGGLKIQSFNPTSCNHNNFNNHSIVTVFEYADIKVVVPGDNEKCSFDELMQRSAFVETVKDADILLAPHHGRESGYNKEFVELVNPRLTIVSDGRFCDTSANARYSAKSHGLKVYKKSKKEFTYRKCLTTNSDGEVFISFGYQSNGDRFLSVSIK